MHGLDITRPLGSDRVQELHQALAENGILLFRDVDITPEQHIEISRHFGALESHVMRGAVAKPSSPDAFDQFVRAKTQNSAASFALRESGRSDSPTA